MGHSCYDPTNLIYSDFTSKEGNKTMLLTIAIPTHNGAMYIQETISSVWNQLSDNLDVEILVLDNASSDQTSEILSEMVNSGVRLTALRNGAVLGPNENFRLAVEMSKGEYVWLLADDDVIIPGGVELMLNTIVETRPNSVVAEFTSVDENLRALSPGEEEHSHPTEEQTPTHEFLYGEDAFRKIGFQLIGLLSANCFRRDLFLKESRDLEIPDGFDFMYVIPSVMLGGGNVRINKRIVLFRQYRKRWETSQDLADSLRIDFLVIPVILRKMKKRGYSKSFIANLVLNRSLTLLWHLSKAKAKGFRPNGQFVFRFVKVNKCNPILMIQLPLFFLSASQLSWVEAFYESKFAELLRRKINRN